METKHMPLKKSAQNGRQWSIHYVEKMLQTATCPWAQMRDEMRPRWGGKQHCLVFACYLACLRPIRRSVPDLFKMGRQFDCFYSSAKVGKSVSGKQLQPFGCWWWSTVTSPVRGAVSWLSCQRSKICVLPFEPKERKSFARVPDWEDR